MPREDERYRNLLPRHPEYCTCVECVQARLEGGDAGGVAGKVGGLVGKLTGKAAKIGKAGKAGKAAKAGQIGKSKGKKRGKTGAAGKAKGRSQAVGEPVRKHKNDCACATCTLLKSI